MHSKFVICFFVAGMFFSLIFRLSFAGLFLLPSRYLINGKLLAIESLFESISHLPSQLFLESFITGKVSISILTLHNLLVIAFCNHPVTTCLLVKPFLELFDFSWLDHWQLSHLLAILLFYSLFSSSLPFSLISIVSGLTLFDIH